MDFGFFAIVSFLNWLGVIFLHIAGILGLLLRLALSTWSVLPGALVSSFRVRLEVIDEFAGAVGVSGLAVGV